MTTQYPVSQLCRHSIRKKTPIRREELDALFQVAYYFTGSRRCAIRFLQQTYRRLRLSAEPHVGVSSRLWHTRFLVRQLRLELPILYPQRIYQPVNQTPQYALAVFQLLTEDAQTAGWFEREGDDLMKLALERLEIEDRALILLVDAQKFTYSETAYILDISEEMVGAVLHIARSNLIEHFYREFICCQQHKK